jgi:Ca-activated chloride channel homolog
LPIAVTAVFAVLLTGVASIGPSVDRARCTQLLIASSQEKSVMLMSFASDYNARKPQVEGRCVLVTVVKKNSGEAETALENKWANDGSPRPDVWSPASSAWVSLLGASPGASLLPPVSDYRYLFASPIVIGMLKPVADQLDYPTKNPSWKQILALATDPNGWGTAQQPHPFKLAKTNPTVSTSGLHALIGSFNAAGAVTEDTVKSRPVLDYMSTIESSVVHYDLTVKTFLSNLDRFDRSGSPTEYVSAIVLEEQELVTYDEAASTLLVPIYPNDGTLVDDHPYLLLSWSQSKKLAAEDFYRFVVDNEQRTIDQQGFREANSDSVLPGGQLAARLAQDGASSTLSPANIGEPSGAVLKLMLLEWRQQLRKPSEVAILVQGAGGKLNAKQLDDEQASLCQALRHFGSNDQVAITPFPTDSGLSVIPLTYVDATAFCGGMDVGLRKALEAKPSALSSKQLDDSVGAAVALLQVSGNPKAFNAVLIVDFGAGVEQPSDDILNRYLRTELRSGASRPAVRVFALGSSSSKLQAIAAAGEGTVYGGPDVSHFFDDLVSDP